MGTMILVRDNVYSSANIPNNFIDLIHSVLTKQR